MITENKLLQYIYRKYGIQDIKDLEDKLLELSSIYDVNQRFLSAKDVSEISDLLLLVPMGRFLISKIFMVIKIQDRVTISQKGKWNIADSAIQMLLKEEIHRPDLLENFKKSFPKILYEELLSNKVNLIIPLTFHDERMGFVLLGNKMNQTTYSLSEIQTLMTIFNMNTPFLLNLYMLDSLKEKNIELANHLQILRTILETTKNLDSIFDKDKVIQLFLLTLMGRLTVTRYLWLVCDDIHESGNYGILAKRKMDFSREQILQIVHALKREQEIHSEPVLLKDLVPELTGENMLVVPYVKESALKSILILGPKLSHVNWSFLEMDFASILLSQVLHILENLELLDEKIQREILEKELNVARAIQNQLLPSTLPGIPNLEIMFYNQPSRQVGGDYCDVILRDNYLYITIADVSGKSIPAALIMSHVQSALRILTEFDLTLTDMVFRLNNQLCENTATDKFVTLFLGRLNLDTYEFEYINAGHNPPFFLNCKTKSVQLLEKGGLLLGMIKNVAYEKGSITLSPDSLLFLYTDGVTETLNPDEKEWGEENLKQFLIRHSHLPAEKLKENLLKTLTSFSGPKESTDDDITFVYLKRFKSN